MTMRRVAACVARGLRGVAVRGHARYGVLPARHDELLRRVAPAASTMTARDEGGDLLTALEAVEAHVAQWRLNKWEHRIAPTLQGGAREQALRQLDMLKSFCIAQARHRASVQRDIDAVAALAGVAPGEVRDKTRAWLQQATAALRWRGEVNAAKQLRDAFVRLEERGAREHKLLERLCCMYGLARLGSFDDAFGGLIVEDATTRRAYVDERNPFHELLARMLRALPQMDVLYALLGFGAADEAYGDASSAGLGYRDAVLRLLRDVLQRRHALHQGDDATASTSNGRVLFATRTPQRELLFDAGDSCARMARDEVVYGLPDALYMRGADVYLVTVASSNHWLRNRQLPHTRQLEGIARRASMVLGLPLDAVRIRNVLLPPSSLDAASLRRLLGTVLGLDDDTQHRLLPWLRFYDRQLDADDVDYAALAKTVDEDEWLTL